jgi:hypothetical protein
VKKVIGLLILVLCVLVSLSAVSAEAADAQFKHYVNERFGYQTDFPNIFSKRTEPQNGDGVIFESGDGKYQLTISGGYNVLAHDGQSELDFKLENSTNAVEGSERSGDGFYAYEYNDSPSRITHVYGLIDEDNWAAFYFSYPKKENDRFGPIIETMEKSLKLGD